jgi:hypothetical protein
MKCANQGGKCGSTHGGRIWCWVHRNEDDRLAVVIHDSAVMKLILQGITQPGKKRKEIAINASDAHSKTFQIPLSRLLNTLIVITIWPCYYWLGRVGERIQDCYGRLQLTRPLVSASAGPSSRRTPENWSKALRFHSVHSATKPAIERKIWNNADLYPPSC